MGLCGWRVEEGGGSYGTLRRRAACDRGGQRPTTAVRAGQGSGRAARWLRISRHEGPEVLEHYVYEPAEEEAAPLEQPGHARQAEKLDEAPLLLLSTRLTAAIAIASDLNITATKSWRVTSCSRSRQGFDP